MPQHTPSERKKNFIQKAIKNPGSFTKTAKKAGAITKKGTIKASFKTTEAKKKGLTGQRARLAITLAKEAKKRKKK